jgi:putative ABC transport system substrate-binding protein
MIIPESARSVVGGILAIAVLFFISSYPVEAQQLTKMARVGFLSAASSSSVAARAEAFREGLRELGYVEGKNLVLVSRYAEGKLDRLSGLANELMRLSVDVIVTGGPTVTGPVKQVNVTIPVIMAQDFDPVANGFITSLARPGGNITGLTSVAPELSGKRLELLKEIIPSLSRVAVFGTSSTPGNGQSLTETETAAATFAVKLQYLDVLSAKDIELAFRAASKGRVDAVLVLATPIFTSERKQLIKLAVKSRLPAIYARPEFVEDGGLMTYGVSVNDLYRRAATYVDKILKGAKPADLPVEQPTKFELVINLKAAKQIGLTIPPNVLARADRIIK